MALEGAVGQDLKESEKNVIGNWTKEDSCRVKSKGLTGLSPVGMWRAHVFHVLGDRAEEISKQSSEGSTSFFLPVLVKRDSREISQKE